MGERTLESELERMQANMVGAGFPRDLAEAIVTNANDAANAAIEMGIVVLASAIEERVHDDPRGLVAHVQALSAYIGLLDVYGRLAHDHLVANTGTLGIKTLPIIYED